jgi:hypothetical protein
VLVLNETEQQHQNDTNATIVIATSTSQGELLLLHGKKTGGVYALAFRSI